MATVRLISHSVLTLFICLTFAAARIVKGPDNVGARVGSRVQLKCMLHHRFCRDVIWMRVEQSGTPVLLYVGGNVQRTADGRYDHYNVNVVRGECTLSINGLQLRDGGTFTCSETGDADAKKAATITVIETNPQMEMNATANRIVDGDTVALSCSLKFRTSNSIRQEDILVTIEHPGAEVIDTETQKDRNEISSVVTVKAKSSKDTEDPTSFGPLQCNVAFTQPANNNEQLATNPVRFPSNEMSAFPILCPVSNIWLDPDTGFQPDEPVTCKANGYPRPSFRWIRVSDNSTVANEAKLVVKSANYTYICIATNTVNRQRYTVMSAEVNFDAATASASTAVKVTVAVVVVVVVLVAIAFIIAFLIYRHKSKDRKPKGENKGGSGSYSLVPTSTNQPRSTTSNADGNLGEESGRADVPPRPDPPTKPVASDQKPSSDGDEGGGGGIVYAELQPPPAKPPRSAATVQAAPDSEYASIISA